MKNHKIVNMNQPIGSTTNYWCPVANNYVSFAVISGGQGMSVSWVYPTVVPNPLRKIKQKLDKIIELLEKGEKK